MPKDSKLHDAILLFGLEMADIAFKLVKDEPKVNTKKLMKSFDPEVKTTAMGTSYTLLMWAEDYFIYVDKGRKPNSTPPPVAPIKEWCIQKGIDEGLAYYIAKNIGINGIPATNISERMMKKVFSNIAWRKFEDNSTSYIDSLVVDNLKGISKKGNITFR